MIKQTIVLCSIACSLSAFGQTVVSTQGDHYETANGSISFTVGEVVINTGTDGTNDLTQGFHQTNWNFVGIEDFAINYSASIYPNPTSEMLNIEVENYENVDYAMYDAAGRIVLKGKLIDLTTIVQVGHLVAGSYQLRLTDESNNPLKNFNLVKHH